MSEFRTGQRWISKTESTLGLGLVVNVADRRVMLKFPAAEEERTYAINQAPLSRIVYKPGDSVQNTIGDMFTVLDVLDHNGLLIYKVQNSQGEDDILPEIELNSFVQLNSPKERLLSGLIDPNKFFKLRQKTRRVHQEYLQSGVMGLLGPRVQLLPHQLYIASQVAKQEAPRVLLADEVGLGKTIEAGLILHQQLQTGLAQRVLILVPDSLLHQWLVEMLRRFNLRFSVLDEQMCQELEHGDANPFEASQLVLCPLSFVNDSSERLQQALACEWDLLLVDEAHHLQWSEQHISQEYQTVAALAEKAKGVLLLTATPEQLGEQSHFARLKLLDPERYVSLEQFHDEQQRFKPLNALLQQLLQAQTVAQWPENLSEFLPEQELANCKAHAKDDYAHASEQVLAALLDRHGTGRALFRNTRQAVKGFPERHLHSYPLTLPEDVAGESGSPIQWLQMEQMFGKGWMNNDARVEWLLDFLQQHRQDKVLLICANAQTAIELERFLRLYHGLATAVFHEDMSLLARDRAAAYFADTEDAAQVLLCSEIGSEGRNFQFAQHLIMFDLPLNPDLLEQRIGRLDRIGQSKSVHIHVPFYENTAQEVLLNWYHQGLNAFEQTQAIGREVFQVFESLLLECLESLSPEDSNNLIAATKEKAHELREALQQGRDRLLELNSCRPKQAEEIIDAMLAAEKRNALEDFIEGVCDQFGIETEPHSASAIILHPGEQMRSGAFDLGEEGFSATFSREMALSREDMQYMTWEHPFVQSAFDQVLNTEHGNTAVATIKLNALPEGTLMLEAFYTINSIAPKHLQLERFLPSQQVRVLISADGKDLSPLLTSDKMKPLLQRLPLATAQALVKQAKDRLEPMFEFANKAAEKNLPAIISQAQAAMDETLGAQLQRLQALAEVNPSINEQSLAQQQSLQDELSEALNHASLQLDAVRAIVAL